MRKNIVCVLTLWPDGGKWQNLLLVLSPDADIFATGNTVIDVLLMTAAKDFEIGIEVDSKNRKWWRETARL